MIRIFGFSAISQRSTVIRSTIRAMHGRHFEEAVVLHVFVDSDDFLLNESIELARLWKVLLLAKPSIFSSEKHRVV